MKSILPHLAIASLLALCPGLRADEPLPIELDPAAIENLQLGYSKAERRPLSADIRAPGVVRLDEQRIVEVTARISGIVDEDFQALGTQVTKDDKLFKLESAELSQTMMAYIDAEQAMAFAHTALDQEKKLVEKNLSSKEQLQQKELAFQQAVAGHERALQPLKVLHFNEGSIHQHLHNVGAGNYTALEVKAPAAGEVIDKSVRIGAAVDPEQTLYTIADLSELWVDFQVPLRDVGALARGLGVSVSSSVSDQTREANVIYIAPLADEASRTVLVRAVLENDDRSWRPGTPVSVAVTGGGEGEETLSVPASAVVDFHRGKAVFVQTSDNAFLPMPVETGPSDGRFTAILSGLEAGASVVSENAAQLKGHLEMTAED